jgi:V8-like Glu-specific endopeptidase
MAMRLSDLEARLARRGAAGAGVVPPPKPRSGLAMSARSMGEAATNGAARHGATNGAGLVEKLEAAGASEGEARRIAGLVAQAEAAEAQSLPRALEARRVVPMPRAREASELAAQAILAAARLSAAGPALEGFFPFCTAADVATSLGVGYLVGFGGGGGQSVGLVVGPNRQIGYFSSLGTIVGFVASISGSVTFAIVRGGLPAFNGQSVTLGFTVGTENAAKPAGPGIGYHHIHDTSGAWIGICGEISLSVGLSPVEVFRGQWETASRTAEALSARRRLDGGARSLTAPAVIGRIAATTAGGFVRELLRKLAEMRDRHDAYRLGVPNTRFFPFSSICQIRSTVPGGTSTGTGFYIAPDRILTAAHVLRRADGSEPGSVTVNVGRNGGDIIRSFAVPAADWRIHPRYPATIASHYTLAHTSFDLAVLKVAAPPPGGLFFTLTNYSPHPATPVAVCGYAGHGGLDVDKQNLDLGKLGELTPDYEGMSVQVLATHGSSGGPAFLEGPIMSGDHDPETIPVMAVYVATSGDLDNHVCLLGPDKQDWATSA